MAPEPHKPYYADRPEPKSHDLAGSRHSERGKPQIPSQGRALATGYSLRRSLENQGVTTEEALRDHLTRVYQELGKRPNIDVTRYRVDKNNPNKSGD